ncbi:hypothetical protein PVAP13_7KG152000 [Panicum virgatum]|uniref:Disease resistance protein At4g27190-like leucine-rich repeats domain-containing protein n=1 Tax=Panicum virgatum TaxID=38727 RepID=A0A8T0QEF0_PANVG|nr:hypothetical protein PVAP13_7KG152000 [Panicum virgatum]
MENWYIEARDVHGAREEIFECIRQKSDKKVIYFNGWGGLGAAPVLRSIEQELRSIKAKKNPSRLCFDTIIYIDCSAWESTRVMQRKIAEELKLGPETVMATFDKQDEVDDLKGVDLGSRDVIPSVSQVINQTLVNRKLVMLFLNGSDDEVDVRKFGIIPDYCNHVIVWTFKRRSLTIHDQREVAIKLRYTHFFISSMSSQLLQTSDVHALLREEAANIVARHPWMQGVDPTMVMKCCLYELFLQYSFHRATGFDWVAHAPNYWMCDGIIKGNGTREITDALHHEIHWVCNNASLLDKVFEKLMKDPEAPFLVVKKDGISFSRESPCCRWVCMTSKNLTIQEDTKAILERASSLFVALDKSENPQDSPNVFLKHCCNLGVLILSHCSFSFMSPPFLQCEGLRFLGLDHCTHDNRSEGAGNNANWVCLQSLWVLDLRYTEWDAIVSEENMDIMTNLRELNIEGFMCWQLISGRLQGRLRYLQKLRIIKPTHKAETPSIACYNPLVDKTDLEILDLSGNRDMENLPANLSMAKSLQMLILDGCDGLKNVAVPDGLPSSLRSFSFDGYGPATKWTSSFKLPQEFSEPEQPHDAYKRDAKTSKISLQACTQLENLFVRGLPNLVELDLSGSEIKVLDLKTMVVDVPELKRLFLLGCENLRAIIWGSYDSMKRLKLEVVCIDTRAKRTPGLTRPSLAQHKHFHLQLHAVLADARLGRSLCHLVEHYVNQRGDYEGTHFNIHVTSSVEYGGGVQLEATVKEKTAGPSNSPQHHVLASPYGDVTTEIGNNNVPMLVFPQPPAQRSDHHIEISNESRSLGSELVADSPTLGELTRRYAESLHVHDAATSASMPEDWHRLKWCHVERCPNMDTIFPAEAMDYNQLQTIWASDLQMARCIWSQCVRRRYDSFEKLQHLHLRSCPRLQFALPVWVPSFPNLETLHIIRCGNLTHVYALNKKYPEEIVAHGLQFPKLTTIHLHDLPKLRQISEVKMLAPALETIRIRGCFGLRRLPALQGREPGVRRPAVEVEKDVWDALEWDGLAAGHHRNLFEPPVHSRYYRRRRLLRGTVLR